MKFYKVEKFVNIAPMHFGRKGSNKTVLKLKFFAIRLLQVACIYNKFRAHLKLLNDLKELKREIEICTIYALYFSSFHGPQFRCLALVQLNNNSSFFYQNIKGKVIRI